MPYQARFIALALWVLPAAVGAVDKLSLGVNVMLGGRYDDLRMCVASPAGIKGGPIADVMLEGRAYVSDRLAVGMRIPVMRPILFGAAFHMLQFEPEILCEYRIGDADDVHFIVGPSLGASFHYGPDYTAGREDTDRDDFFAAGPLVSAQFGVGFPHSAGLKRIAGMRAFYAPLFAKEHAPGTVVGAALEGHFEFFQNDRR
ncbi:MAG: hypothetical protein GF418_02205 [Chitinivibrionales bacterium]|nr:hypothetical protein [Chitinivibrionales bacterium]MBD3394414.1 hypothetical protein [Chitinivibrionales bacterium]